MSIRKYRLAQPVNDDQLDVLHRPRFTVSSSPHRLTVFVDHDVNTKTTLLNGSQKAAEVLPNTSTPRWWLVLPCLVLIMFVTAADILLLNDLIIRRYEKRYGLSMSSHVQHQACRQSMSTPMPAFYSQFDPWHSQSKPIHPDYTTVQHDAARFQMKNSIIILFSGLTTFILLGANCDTIGRRPSLVLPFIGKVCLYSMLLIIISFDLSDPWLLAATATESAFGSTSLVMMSAFAYVTDCTVGPTRTRAFVITEGLHFVTRVIPVLALGVWLRFRLYTVPLSVCLILSVIGLAYGSFILPESLESA